jgi:nitrite reductase/ring-hydroxylating ferredoxin subunit
MCSSDANDWADAGPVTGFPADEKVCTTAGGKPVVIARVGDDWFAFANICPHAGLPLGEGELRGHVITCPFHGNAYNIRNGRNIDWPEEELPVRTYPVRVEDGRVMVGLGQRTPQPPR